MISRTTPDEQILSEIIFIQKMLLKDKINITDLYFWYKVGLFFISLFRRIFPYNNG